MLAWLAAAAAAHVGPPTANDDAPLHDHTPHH